MGPQGKVAGPYDGAMLKATELHKAYGPRTAVAGISIEVRAGEIVGLLGPNGAGKSTTVAMLCGLTPPDRGEVTVAGLPVAGDASPAKKRIGLVLQDISLFEDLPAIRNLELFNPMFYTIDAFRHSYTGASYLPLPFSLSVIFGLAAISLFIALRMMSAGYKLRT